MSEFLAEARVLIRPDTTAFRTELISQLAVVTKGITVPVPVTPVVSGAAAGAQASVQAAVNQGLLTQADAAKQAAAAQEELGRRTGQTTKQLLGAGTASQNLNSGLLGLRAAAGTTAVIGLGAVSLAAIAAGQALRSSVTSAIDFEKQLNVFAVTAEATGTQMRQVSDTARELGRDISLPGVSAGDAAQTLTLLAKAGLDVENSLGAVRGTLQLATAAQIENAAAAELVANALNSFSLPGEQAARVADLLAAASNESQGSILDMGIALRQVAPVAKLVNLSVEDTVTILTQLARSGLSASDAGTSFRQALLRLIQDMPKVNAQVEKLGLELRDAQGELRPEVFGELEDALRGMSPAARQAAVAALGGADAIRTFGLLAQDGAEAFQRMQETLTQGGEAAKLAAANTEGLGGDLQALSNSAEEAGLTLGKLASPVLSSLAGGLNLTLTGVNSLADSIRRLIDPPKQAATTVAGLRTELAAAKKELDAFIAKGGVETSGGEIVLAALVQKVNELSVALDDKLVGASKRSTDGMTAWVKVMKDAAAAAKVAAEEIAGPLTSSMIEGQLQAQQTAVANARAFGDQGLQELIDLRDRIDVILEGPQRPVGQPLEDLLNQRAATIASIEDIYRQNAEAKKAAGDRIVKAQDAADQAFVDKVERGASKRANRLLIAEGTKTLADDIATQQAIRRFYLDRIKEVAATVKDAELAARLISQFTGKVITAEQAIAAAKEEQAKRREDAKKEQERVAREAAEKRVASIDLDIELAQTTENESKEVAARNRKIKELQRQLAVEAEAHGKNTLLYKQIRNEIAAEKAALDDLKDEQESATDSARSFRQATFDFLQAQQGFAANLLGNLIPGSATAGLVGNQSPLTQPVGATAPPPGTGHVPIDFGLGAMAGVAEAKQQGGVTAGQAQTTNGLLNMIYRELVELNTDRKAPEANRQRVRQQAALDGVGGG